jgi:hypothetical protein
MGLTISDATSTTITSNPLVQPNHPGGFTSATITEINHQYLVSQDVYRIIYQQADKSLHNQLISAVSLIYIKIILDKTIGWSNITCLHLLKHFWTTYI